jgi:hypothetical protein
MYAYCANIISDIDKLVEWFSGRTGSVIKLHEVWSNPLCLRECDQTPWGLIKPRFEGVWSNSMEFDQTSDSRLDSPNPISCILAGKGRNQQPLTKTERQRIRVTIAIANEFVHVYNSSVCQWSMCWSIKHPTWSMIQLSATNSQPTRQQAALLQMNVYILRGFLSGKRFEKVECWQQWNRMEKQLLIWLIINFIVILKITRFQFNLLLLTRLILFKAKKQN